MDDTNTYMSQQIVYSLLIPGGETRFISENKLYKHIVRITQTIQTLKAKIQEIFGDTH